MRGFRDRPIPSIGEFAEWSVREIIRQKVRIPSFAAFDVDLWQDHVLSWQGKPMLIPSIKGVRNQDKCSEIERWRTVAPHLGGFSVCPIFSDGTNSWTLLDIAENFSWEENKRITFPDWMNFSETPLSPFFHVNKENRIPLPDALVIRRYLIKEKKLGRERVFSPDDFVKYIEDELKLAMERYRSPVTTE